MKMIILFLTFFALSLSNVHGQIFFQDDFESDSQDWQCTDGSLSKWISGGCGFTHGFGAEWRMGLGRNGGNALYSWKRSGVSNGYRSESRKWFTGSDVKTEIYHRWYMKIPPANQYNKNIEHGFKFWRYITRENGYSNPQEVYLNVYGGSTFATSNLALLTTAQPYQYLKLIDINKINDGQWHCHEIRLVANTEGNYDGLAQYWLNGKLIATHNNIMWSSATPKIAWHNIGVGVGNVSDSDWFQSDWSAIAFDDVIVSTNYIGCNYVLSPPDFLRFSE
jgi:hypothetical protein